MSDYETLRAMYEKAGIGYQIEESGNFYMDGDRFSVAIVTVAKENGVAGYSGFTSCHTFDAEGNLLHVYNWE